MDATSSDVDEEEAIPLPPQETSKATTPPASLRTSISPPPPRIRVIGTSPRSTAQRKSADRAANLPNPAALEAGLTSILPDQQLQYWSTHLAKHINPSPSSPLLTIPAFRNLYTRNAAAGPRPCRRSSGGPPRAPSNHNGGGKHFVIHQHDHPVAGLHYDLRLQINGTSSVSWAIMYGLPGDPNNKARVNRNATETRVHCLWNHLIETASASTGSMLIWDTGDYEVLPYHSTPAREPETSSDDDNDDDGIDDDNDSEATLAPSYDWRDHISHYPHQRSPWSSQSEQEKLHQSFQHRKLRLRLHGTRLPANYTLTLRLSSSAPDILPPLSKSIPSSSRKRKRKPLATSTPQTTPPPPSTTSDTDTDDNCVQIPNPEKTQQKTEEEEAETCLTNAYPGATNSIGSSHQRRWYLSLDRAGCGFVRVGHDGNGRRGRGRGATQWIRARGKRGGGGGQPAGFEPFYVLGRDVERSVVTGRTAGQVMRDERVEGFVSRRGWRGKV